MCFFKLFSVYAFNYKLRLIYSVHCFTSPDSDKQMKRALNKRQLLFGMYCVLQHIHSLKVSHQGQLCDYYTVTISLPVINGCALYYNNIYRCLAKGRLHQK